MKNICKDYRTAICKKFNEKGFCSFKCPFSLLEQEASDIEDCEDLFSFIVKCINTIEEIANEE